MLTSPDRFAAVFNMTFPDAYRIITGQDVRDMTECGLIREHGGYYSRADLQRIRAVLQYEQMRQARSAKVTIKDKLESPKCKMCGKPLPLQSEGKKGRPREYCSNCESSRNKERYRRWRKKRRRPRVESASRGA